MRDAHGEALIKNRYVGRTFIQPDQALREHGIRTKFNPLDDVAGKRIVVVDNSIVRGTTTRKIVAMLFEAGAAEVHLRISSPPIVSPCFYGVDMATEEELIASTRTVEEIRARLGATSLAYLSLEGLQDGDAAARERVLPGVPHARVSDAGARDSRAREAQVRAPARPRPALAPWPRGPGSPRSTGSVVATLPGYERLQEETVAATVDLSPGTILELGVGTGVTSARLLAAHPGARSRRARRERADARGGAGSDSLLSVSSSCSRRLEDPLPGRPLRPGRLGARRPPPRRGGQAVTSSDASPTRLARGGRFVLADVVVPRDPADARVELEAGYDLPSTVEEQLGWLRDAGLRARGSPGKRPTSP